MSLSAKRQCQETRWASDFFKHITLLFLSTVCPKVFASPATGASSVGSPSMAADDGTGGSDKGREDTGRSVEGASAGTGFVADDDTGGSAVVEG